MELQGLSKYCGRQNYPGIVRIEYLPTKWVDGFRYESIITNAWNWQVQIPLLANRQWLTAYTLTKKNIWNESQGGSRQGKYYDQTVNLVLPAMRPEVSGELDSMANYRYLLKIMDRQKRNWILGTLETPFDFTVINETGDTNGFNNYELEFNSRTPHKAYGFQPFLTP